MSTAENPTVLPALVTSGATLPERIQPHLPNVVGSIARWLGNRSAQVQSLFISNPEQESLLRKARTRGTQMKDEHPMTLLALMMAGAFVLGVSARIWSPYER